MSYTITGARLANASGTAVEITTAEWGSVIVDLVPPADRCNNVEARAAYEEWRKGNSASAYVAPTDVPPPTLSEMFAAIRDKLDGKAGADGKLNAVAAKLGAGKAS